MRELLLAECVLVQRIPESAMRQRGVRAADLELLTPVGRMGWWAGGGALCVVRCGWWVVGCGLWVVG